MIQAIAERAARFDFPLVVDPVMISKHGVALLDEAAIDALINLLLPHAFLVTPNRYEAARITGQSTKTVSDMIRAAETIARRGVRYVLDQRRDRRPIRGDRRTLVRRASAALRRLGNSDAQYTRFGLRVSRPPSPRALPAERTC